MIVSGEAWADLFTSFQHAAWRYECQGEYHEPDEAEPFRKFLAGEPDDLGWMSGWLGNVRAATAAGRTFARVRVLTDPLTDYLRWELEIGKENAAAGEDIRLLDAKAAAELELPETDFWLFDNTTVAIMRFRDHGFDHAVLHTEATSPELVQGCRAAQARALSRAVPLADANTLLGGL